MTSYDQDKARFILNNYSSVQVAGIYSGYSLQYLRRLLRNGQLGCVKIGQLWLVDKGALDICLKQVQNTADQRFGLKQLMISQFMIHIKQLKKLLKASYCTSSKQTLPLVRPRGVPKPKME
jgi:hypothetical protein